MTTVQTGNNQAAHIIKTLKKLRSSFFFFFTRAGAENKMMQQREETESYESSSVPRDRLWFGWLISEIRRQPGLTSPFSLHH